MPRPRSRVGLLALTASLPALYALLVRPRLKTWGATPEEVAGPYPEDALVPAPDRQSTMATDLPAPPEAVWPWLVQMGGDRGGWYSWDRLDHGGRPSADHVVAKWQDLEVGEHLTQDPQGNSWFEVATLEPEHTLVLRSDLALPSGHSFDPRSAPWPSAYLDGTWAFHLTPTVGGGTRLVVRTRGQGSPHRFTRPFDLLVGEPAHFAMQVRQFQNLRRLVAAAA